MKLYEKILGIHSMFGKNGTLYVGVTNNLARRIYEHKYGNFSKAFTQKYGVDQLVYFEEFFEVNDALKREKILKWWNRAWKLALIEEKNPDWDDLYSSLLGSTDE